MLDNLSTLADANRRPTPILWAGALYLVLWLFLSGGILDRYARAAADAVVRVLHGVRHLFRPLPAGWRPSWRSPTTCSSPWCTRCCSTSVYGELIRDVSVERSAFFLRLALYLLFGALLVTVNAVIDYAKVRAVVEDRRSMIGALAAGARFVRRNPGAVAGLYLLNAALFVLVLLVYALVAPGAESTGAGLWLGFLVSQIYLAGRLWVRLVFFASETVLFQGRLAHAGYIASAPVARPEPPIVEQALR